MSRTPCQIFYSFYKAAKSIPYPPSEKSANLDIHRRDDEQHRLDQNLPSLDGVGKEFEDIYNGSRMNEFPAKNLIIVGVMTAKKFLNTRVIAGHRTWANTIPGRVIYFCSDIQDNSSSRSTANIFQSSPNFRPQRVRINVDTSNPNINYAFKDFDKDVDNDDNEPLIISLPGVTDDYPPQKKSFMMLKFLYDNFIDEFRWFVRADDDVFIKGEELGRLLKSLNENVPYFIGQTGQGMKEEMGLLNLNYDENFCMGGPSIIMSRETLFKMAPHIKYCLNHLYTFHEDVEIGRCVKTFAGIPCSWSYETQKLFLHNSFGTILMGNSSAKSINAYNRAITLHPFKNHLGFYDAQAHFLNLKLRSYRHLLWKLLRKKATFATTQKKVTAALIEDFDYNPVYKTKKDIPQYAYIVKDYILLSHLRSNPKRKLDNNIRVLINDIKNGIVTQLNRLVNTENIYFTKGEIHWAYISLDNPYGNKLYLSIMFCYHKDGADLNNWIEGEFSIIYPFLNLIFEEANFSNNAKVSLDHKASKYSNSLIDFSNLIWKPMLSKFVNNIPLPLDIVPARAINNIPKYSVLHKAEPNRYRINFIVPLCGRLNNFKRFLNNFETICLKNKIETSLLIVLFKTPQDIKREELNVDLNSTNINLTTDTESTITLIDKLREAYRDYSSLMNILQVKGEFSRGLALEIGASQYVSQDLLFFIDVDMIFDYDFLRRVRYFTKLNESIYFPIVFSQFNPDFTYGNDSINKRKLPSYLYENVDNSSSTNTRDLHSFKVTAKTGTWRSYGYGIVGIYKYDFTRVGGFDMGIFGWGKEDVDLFDKCIAKKYDVIHAPDPGLIHVFHDSICPPTLNNDQFIMCIKSKSSTLGNHYNLYNHLFKS
ncbi:unnamed protein product [Gordionus sp. m RMFG-2023]